MLSISLFLTTKTLWALICYASRIILEGIIDEFRLIKRLGVDFSYISLVFIGFNLIQKEPRPRFYSFVDMLTKQYPDINEKFSPIILVVFTLLLLGLSIFCQKHFNKTSSNTFKGLLIKGLAITISYGIGVALFLLAVVIQ